MSVSGLNPQEYDLTELRRTWYLDWISSQSLRRTVHASFVNKTRTAKNAEILGLRIGIVDSCDAMLIRDSLEIQGAHGEKGKHVSETPKRR